MQVAWSQIDWTGIPPFSLETFLSAWPENRSSSLCGLLLFGSRLRGRATERSDLDIGVLYRGPRPDFPGREESWDLFFWNVRHWRLGFILQIEVARAFYILDDPDRILESQLQAVQKFILPHYAGYAPRL
ncbi:MAG: nucleotidyltransferase domain-containing protein [Spirochaetales bacterium]|nr:nucleotidyltransferase domain-containing protein [Spirochaetales bacterium]